MRELLPNLVPPALLLLLWALASAGGAGRSLSRGFLYALVVTSVAALPAVLLSASNGFRGLGAMGLFTLILAMFGAGAGAIAFAVGLFKRPGGS